MFQLVKIIKFYEEIYLKQRYDNNNDCSAKI